MRPGKFYDAVAKAVPSLPPLPAGLAAVQSLEMRSTDVACTLEAAQALVLERCDFSEEATAGASLSPVVFLPILLALALVFVASPR